MAEGRLAVRTPPPSRTQSMLRCCPLSPALAPADKAAADAFMVFQYAWMADPLYFGHYPPLMVATQGLLLPT
jgi:hypothetical protein